jgi:SAM-dependent methyltransferase
MTDTVSLTLEQAHAYEDLFVPALFSQWVQPLLDCAGVAQGHRVLDVACGTGVVARAAWHTVGSSGQVSGLDLNPAMIEVARQIQPGVHWRVGDAARLPYDDNTFDVALCQSALFFFPDAEAAVREMARVAVPGGAVALQTYAGLEDQPGYGPFRGHRMLLNTYWSKGDLDELQGLLAAAGLSVTTTRSILGAVTFPSVDALVHTEIQATPLAQRIADTAYRAIGEEVRQVLAPFTTTSRALDLAIQARLISARKPTPDHHRALTRPRSPDRDHPTAFGTSGARPRLRSVTLSFAVCSNREPRRRLSTRTRPVRTSR